MSAAAKKRRAEAAAEAREAREAARQAEMEALVADRVAAALAGSMAAEGSVAKALQGVVDDDVVERVKAAMLQQARDFGARDGAAGSASGGQAGGGGEGSAPPGGIAEDCMLVDDTVQAVMAEMGKEKVEGQGQEVAGQEEEGVASTTGGQTGSGSVGGGGAVVMVSAGAMVQTEIEVPAQFASDADLARVQFSRPEKAGGGLMGMASGVPAAGGGTGQGGGQDHIHTHILRMPVTAMSATLAKAGLRAALQAGELDRMIVLADGLYDGQVTLTQLVNLYVSLP